jgi:hypothetical protein
MQQSMQVKRGRQGGRTMGHLLCCSVLWLGRVGKWFAPMAVPTGDAFCDSPG